MITNKFAAFLSKEKCSAPFVALLVLINVGVFISGCLIKLNYGLDTIVDALKLCMVSNNIILLNLLLHQKRILSYGTMKLKYLFITFVGILTTMALVALVLEYKVAVSHNSTFQEVAGAQKDYILLGTSLATDLSYLILYILFKSTRASLCTVVLIVVEMVIFGVAANAGSDAAIDIANLVIALITGILSLLLWTAKVALDENGKPLELVDFIERDDLELMIAKGDDENITPSNFAT